MSRASPSCCDERECLLDGKDPHPNGGSSFSHLLLAIFDIVQFRQRKGFSPRNQVLLVTLYKVKKKGDCSQKRLRVADSCAGCVSAARALQGACPVRARAVCAIQVIALRTRAAHACVPVLCARCARALCRRPATRSVLR